VPEVLLVLQSLQEFGDDLQLLQDRNAKTLYETSQTIGTAFTLAEAGRV